MSNYWAKRTEEHIKSRLKEDYDNEKKLEELYRTIQRDIDNEIRSFWSKYATANGLTIDEAMKKLSKTDVKAFEKHIKRLIKEQHLSDDAKDRLKDYNAMMRLSRLEEMKEYCNVYLASLYDKETQFLYQSFNKEMMDQLKEQAGILSSTEQLKPEQLQALLNRDYSEGSFSDRIWNNKQALLSELDKTVRQCIALGLNSNDVVRQFAKKLDTSLNNAKRILRTENAKVMVEQQMQNFKHNDIEYYQVILDPGACKHCRKFGETAKNIDNARMFKVSEMRTGSTAPPFHPYCRCSTIPVTESVINDKNKAYEKALKLPSNTFEEEEEKQLAVMGALGLSEKEQRSLLGYIGFDYAKINHHLREGIYNNNTEQVKLLRSALDKIPTYQGKVYRYANLPKEILKNNILNALEFGEIKERSFISTTKKDDILDVVEKPNVKYIIYSNNGHDLKGINDDEQEVLFKNNSKFDIINIDQKDKIIEIYMKEGDESG